MLDFKSSGVLEAIQRMNPVAGAGHPTPNAGWSHFDHDADIGVRGYGPSVETAFEQVGMPRLLADILRFASMATFSPPSKRAKPGSRGGGRFFHIEVRPSTQFVSFRVQDVGTPGGVERVAGRRASGSWDTAKWLVEKTHAHVEDGHLVPDSAEAEKLFAGLGSAPVHVEGDRFHAEPHRGIPEGEKPTPAMRRARLANIKKAQAAVRARRKGPTQ